jgi:hypothetical protein
MATPDCQTTYNSVPDRVPIPYFILYNKFSGILRVHAAFGNSNAQGGKVIISLNIIETRDATTTNQESNFNYSEEWKWIIHDWQEKHLENSESYSNPNGLFHLHYIPKYFLQFVLRYGYISFYNLYLNSHFF